MEFWLYLLAPTLLLQACIVGLRVQAVDASQGDCTLDCENDGFCTKQWQTAARSASSFVQVMSCMCMEGFSGPLCETEVGADGNEDESNDGCTLQCFNGGLCEWEWTSAGLHAFDKRMLCQCPESFSGDQCENENTEESPVTAMECTRECLHGTCVIEWTSDTTSSHKFVASQLCKCEEGFEGDLCQDEVIEVILTEPTPSTPCSHTCHNGGTCVSKWETAPLANDALIEITGCECALGFTGPSCEIEIDENSNEDECHLSCQNGGECVFAWMETGTHNSNYFNSVYLSSFMICECPTGYMGLHCEYEVESCPDHTMCFNGGKCVENEAEDQNDKAYLSHVDGAVGSPPSYICDCSSVPDKEGNMCEQQKEAKVDICDYSLVGHDRSLFCVNGGTCKLASSDEEETNSSLRHHGCDCPDDFFGHHCEFVLEASMAAGMSRETKAIEASHSSTKAFTITVGVLSAIAGATLAVVFATRTVLRDTRSPRVSGTAATVAVPSTLALEADGTSIVEQKQEIDRQCNVAGASETEII